MWANPPYVLFVVVELSIEQLNEILETAFQGTEFSENCFWLPYADDYSDAPKKVQGVATQGTAPPVSSYKSPFIGKTGRELAKWLQNKPKEADVDIHHFAILDKTAERGNMVVARQGGPRLEDLEDLEFLRFGTRDATSMVFSIQPLRWEEWKGPSGLVEIEY